MKSKIFLILIILILSSCKNNKTLEEYPKFNKKFYGVTKFYYTSDTSLGYTECYNDSVLLRLDNKGVYYIYHYNFRYLEKTNYNNNTNNIDITFYYEDLTVNFKSN